MPERTAIALNSSPMPVGDIRRWTPVSISPARSGLAAISRAARSAMPRRPRNSAWAIGPSATNPAARALSREGREANVGRQVGPAGQAQRVDPGVPVHGLQGIAIGRLRRTVVDEERDEGRLAAGPAGRAARPRRRAARGWRPACGCAGPSASWSTLGPARKPQAALRIRRLHPLAPGPIDKHKLPDGQSIQELVGDDDCRAIRHLVDGTVPDNRRALPLPTSCRGQPSA